MTSSDWEAFAKTLQEAALPAVWSRGVALSREAQFIADRLAPEETTIRVLLKNRPVHPRVSLWLAEGDSYCDCGDRNEPCIHIVAAALALKNGQIALESSSTESRKPVQSGVSYRLIRQGLGSQGRQGDAPRLRIERWIRSGDDHAPLRESLTSFIGGIQSGRISHAPVATTQEDFKIDQLLSHLSDSAMGPNRDEWARLLGLLENASDLELDGKPVRSSSSPVQVQAEVISENGGFRLKRKANPLIQEVFEPGLALLGEILKPVAETELSSEDRELLRGEGSFFGPRNFDRLFSEIVPRLQSKLSLILPETGTPRLSDARPRIAFEIDSEGPDALSVLADLVYGEPAIARVRLDLKDSLECLSRNELPRRDVAEERSLLHWLQSEFHLRPGHRVRITGDAAPDLLRKLGTQSRIASAPHLAQVALTPRLSARENDVLELAFEAGSQSVPFQSVFQAWRDGREFVPLLSGGWAPLPKDWLSRFGARIEALLAARDSERKLPRYFAPELASLCEETQSPCPSPLSDLSERLKDFSGIPESELPADLTITPRPYQKRGIDWLCFLREQKLGALLADDMGLGKTLQALCAIQGRTLIICPTSVLSSWQEQIARFRPKLKVSLYHERGRGAGPKRALDPSADVTLSTYGVLRLDRDPLSSLKWDTIVLDEAHFIKNPDSQIARAAHSLQAPFKIALSGTPVENRLQDLWSQFQFINPGLLGTREDFEDRFSATISRGDRAKEEMLRTRVKPFLLRRLKREVAPELPPRTEVLLHCELSTTERELYDSILAANRTEVLSQLGRGGSVFAALETLLRLRQACCHSRLVPQQGHAVPSPSSSKTDLLLETLQESIGLGHRSLVFSQWTSFLDLIEPLLKNAGIDFCRLDGSTPNREEVVRRFQSPDGPPVFLLSLKAGGVGLTLTAADHVFLLDPWWNPTVEDQAADRAHRIGQENPVLIHRLVAKNTLEDRILELQREKQRLSGAIFEGTSQAHELTREDIVALLS